MNLKEIRELSGVAYAAANAIHEKAENENRKMSDEERGKWDSYMNEMDGLKDQEIIEVRHQEAARTVAAVHNQAVIKPESKRTLEERQMDGFAEFLSKNRADCNAELMKEFRAMQTDLDVSGGYLAAPEQFVAELIQNVDDAHVVRQLSRKFSLKKSVSLGAPSLDTDLSAFSWGSEIGTPTFDSSLALGKRALNPHPANAAIKVSRTLIRLSAINVVDLVRERLTEAMANGEGTAFLTGSGSNQPLGIFTASADGISTGRDVSTGNSSTNISFDNAIYVETALKAAYRANASWIMHRNVERNYRLLKDGEGRYIWQPSVVVGKPSTILGYPIFLDEDAPSTFSGSGYMSILGDFSQYWIADALDMELQRLDELYAETNQVGFIARFNVDGMPVKEEAFSRSQLA